MELCFDPGFLAHTCTGDYIDLVHEGFLLRATIHRDDDQHCPWEWEDGHGPVTDWTTRDKRPGERVLCADRNHRRYYDFEAAVRLARTEWIGERHESWEGRTAPQQAAHLAELDYRNLVAWCRGDWFYCGVGVQVLRSGIALTGPYDHCIWGVDLHHPQGDVSYLTQLANDQIDEALEHARQVLTTLCGCPKEETK